jgi:type VI secretion system protein ImpK
MQPHPSGPLPEPEPRLRMPSPGGQPTVVLKRQPATPASPAATATPNAGLQLQRLVAGINPLLGAASTLLALAEQLRHAGLHDDPAALRRQLLEQVAAFEADAAAAGVPRPKVTAARYLLCSFLDEAIAGTPWGAASGERTLLQAFHEERSGADKSFELLERLGQDPAANADLLELFYVCLRLGFEGRWRGSSEGRAQLDAIARRVLELVRPANASNAGARSLSEPDQGVARLRQGERTMLSPWLIALLAGALIVGGLLALVLRLDAMTQPVFHRLVALPQPLRVERAAAAAARPRLAGALQAEVAQGLLAVRDEALRSVVTLPADALFVPGSANLDAAGQALVARVAQALSQAAKDTPAQIAVIGHTDDAAVASLQFPSAWHRSQAWARAVSARLAQSGVPAQRLRAEGRGDAEPLSTDRDAATRARNRRVDIELRLPRPEPAGAPP